MDPVPSCSRVAFPGHPVKKPPAGAASLEYVKFQAMIKPAASAAPLAEAARAADLITAFLGNFWQR